MDRTHEEPVYRDWCTYNIDRWREDRRPAMSGDGTQDPVWPELPMRECTEVNFGCERAGSRQDKYEVHFQDTSESQTYDCAYSQRAWESFSEGTTYDAIVKVLGGRFQCESVKP